MKRKFTLLLLLTVLFAFGVNAQTQIYLVDFETATGYTTSVPEFSDAGYDFFTRTDGSNIGTGNAYNNPQGSYFFAGMDLDGEGATLPLTLNINDINITGYTSLEFRVYLAEDDDGTTNQDWDEDSYFHITGSIDGATAENLIWVEAEGGTNTLPRIDTNFDGVGNGTEITSDFVQYTASISGTGNLLDLVFEFGALDSGDEDIAIDHIEIYGVSGSSNDADSYADASGVTQPAAGAISSLMDTQAEAFPVFQFNITDAGSGDALPTEVTEITIKAGPNNTADWTADVDGAYLYKEGVGALTVTTDPNVLPGQVTFFIDEGELDIPDGGSQLITLHIWHNVTVTDNAVFECMIDADDHDFKADHINGSNFAADFGTDVVGNQISIDVVATQFSFLQQPENVLVDNLFSNNIQVGLIDENGNIDVDYEITGVQVVFTGSGNMFGMNGVGSVDGIATYTDLYCNTVQTGAYLTAHQTTGAPAFSDLQSDNFDVTAPLPVEKILLTELVLNPTEGELIEIYNPGAGTVDLSNYYITDATFSGGGAFYYNITTGVDYGGGGYGDFHARFPDGATIAAGEYQTIALNGSDDFFAEYGIDPDYELYEDAGSPDAIPDMLEAMPGSINGQGGISNTDEVVILYNWDGYTDLVTDIDYAVFGDKDEGVDKTGITIGSETYLDDTSIASQESLDTDGHPYDMSWQRYDYTEGTQTTSGGNGVGGSDETSENLSVTWITTYPSPGEEYSKRPHISNVVIAPVAPDNNNTVAVSGDVLDIDDSFTAVTVNWSLDRDNLTNSINMSPDAGDTYTADADIPAQAVDAVVYYAVTITDAPESTTSDTLQYTVIADTGIEDILNKVSMSPNPATDVLTIRNMSDVKNITVVNILGEIVKAVEVRSSTIEINVNDLNKGVYFIRFNTTNGIIVNKSFIKQ